MGNPLYPVIEGMMNYLTKQDVTIADIESRLPRYFAAIMEEIKQADKYCVEGDKEKTEAHAKRAMGYFKKAKSILGGQR
ncbi:MAG: hypothetical protein A4E65_02294 [Syntrophorhabdus sp. PtaU1.Bin153]|nr:MAG: hypothetical protein A4E65_02294 [Syntrophorhabdus sp. PtaU1.Bin153]